MNFSKSSCIFLVVFQTIFCLGQNLGDEDYVFLKRHEHVVIKVQGKDLEVKKSVLEEAKFLSTNKMYLANESIHFDSFSEIDNINAYTIEPSSNKQVKVNYIETKKEFDNGIFYSDQELKTFTFPAISPGSITHLEYDENIKDPRFLGLFRFGTFKPTQHAKLSVEFPKEVDLGYILFNTEASKLKFYKTKEGSKNLYTWEIENVAAYQPEEDSESPLHYVPHIIIYVKTYTKNGQTYNISNDVDGLYAWYTTMVEKIDRTGLEEVYEISERITKDCKSDSEKAEKIFDWVQENINYVAFEDGLGGFIPRGAESVYRKRYGDCKDMANLLYEMLNHVGVKSYRTWIGTRNRQYTYNEVPTPMVDNHMIAAAIVEKDTLFLDATDNYISYGMPSSFIQGKEALIGIGPKKYVLKTVPVQDMEKNVTTVNTSISIENNKVKVQEQRTMKGYEKVSFIWNYNKDKDTDTDEEYLNKTLELGNNKTKYLNIEKKYFDNSNNPLELTYNLEIETYERRIGEKIYLNLNIDKTLSNSLIDIEKRKYSKKIDHKFQKEFLTAFQIPENYTVTNLPEDASYATPAFGFYITYQKEGTTIIQKKKIYVNTLGLKKQDFETWNDFIKNLVKATKKSIIIEKT